MIINSIGVIYLSALSLYKLFSGDGQTFSIYISAAFILNAFDEVIKKLDKMGKHDE